MNTNSSVEKPPDVSQTRFEDGLSCPMYIVQMVKNKNDPDAVFHPNIVHCGKTGTSRSTLFYCENTNLVGLDGKPAGTKNNQGLKSFNNNFLHLFEFFEPIFSINPDLKIPIFTELRKDKVLYRGDPCSHYAMEETEMFCTRSWCDWALFKYHGNDNRNRSIPGQILGFTSFDNVPYTDAYNKIAAADDKVASLGGGYGIAGLTSRELVGFLDPSTQPIPKHQMQANSSLLFWEEKEIVAHCETQQPAVTARPKPRGKKSSPDSAQTAALQTHVNCNHIWAGCCLS